ncbi:phosphoglycolate phosphatase [Babesia caballi]|uniref:Phosphoglycolate phosphatase n=1 Tax=Babesia caballi TaxID=5871 RepID=A0AAV4M045_BABCB|nr:phosphoglycolate phosphatase [Babesia caballi]
MMATQNDPPTTGEEREEDGVVEVITQYAKNIARSLKDAVTHTVDAGRQASDSLAELQSQNENLSRIKHCLNESHKTVSATQKIVDTYVNSVRWISSSIPWQRATELSSDKATSESTSIVAKLPSYWSTSFWTTKDEAEAPEVGVTDPIKRATHRRLVDNRRALGTHAVRADAVGVEGVLAVKVQRRELEAQLAPRAVGVVDDEVGVLQALQVAVHLAAVDLVLGNVPLAVLQQLVDLAELVAQVLLRLVKRRGGHTYLHVAEAERRILLQDAEDAREAQEPVGLDVPQRVAHELRVVAGGADQKREGPHPERGLVVAVAQGVVEQVELGAAQVTLWHAGQHQRQVVVAHLYGHRVGAALELPHAVFEAVNVKIGSAVRTGLRGRLGGRTHVGGQVRCPVRRGNGNVRAAVFRWKGTQLMRRGGRATVRGELVQRQMDPSGEYHQRRALFAENSAWHRRRGNFGDAAAAALEQRLQGPHQHHGVDAGSGAAPVEVHEAANDEGRLHRGACPAVGLHGGLEVALLVEPVGVDLVDLLALSKRATFRGGDADGAVEEALADERLEALRGAGPGAREDVERAQRPLELEDDGNVLRMRHEVHGGGECLDDDERSGVRRLQPALAIQRRRCDVALVRAHGGAGTAALQSRNDAALHVINVHHSACLRDRKAAPVPEVARGFEGGLDYPGNEEFNLRGESQGQDAVFAADGEAQLPRGEG